MLGWLILYEAQKHQPALKLSKAPSGLGLTWDGVLVVVLVPAAEGGDSAGDEDHECDGDTAHDEQQLHVDLAVAAGEPLAALAHHVLAGQHALAVLVAKVTLRRGC